MKKKAPSKNDASGDLLRTLKVPRSGPPAETAPAANFIKISVSLFPPDMDAADRLMEKMRRNSKGLVTRSDAFKLALRYAADTISDREMQTRTSAIKGEDRRVRGNL